VDKNLFYCAKVSVKKNHTTDQQYYTRLNHSLYTLCNNAIRFLKSLRTSAQTLLSNIFNGLINLLASIKKQCDVFQQRTLQVLSSKVLKF